MKHVYRGVRGACPRQAVTSAGVTAERSERRDVGTGLKLVRTVEEEGLITYATIINQSHDAKFVKFQFFACGALKLHHRVICCSGRWGGPTKHGIYNWELSGIQRSTPQLPSNYLGTMNHHLHTPRECQV